MVNSAEWSESKWPKEAGARKVRQYLMQASFWNNIRRALKLMTPLVKVFRMVDGEKNQLWDTFMQPWTGQKRQSKGISTGIKRSTKKPLRSLTKGGSVSFTILCMLLGIS